MHRSVRPKNTKDQFCLKRSLSKLFYFALSDILSKIELGRITWCSVLKELNAKIGRELVKSFVNVFVRLLLIWSSSLDLAAGRKYFDIVSPKSI